MHYGLLLLLLNANLLSDITYWAFKGVFILDLNFSERNRIHHLFNLLTILYQFLRGVVEVNYL